MNAVTKPRRPLVFLISILTVLAFSAIPADAHIPSNYGGNHAFARSGAGSNTWADDTVTDGHCTYAAVWDGNTWYEGAKSCANWVKKWVDTDNSGNLSHAGYGCITGHWSEENCGLKKWF